MKLVTQPNGNGDVSYFRADNTEAWRETMRTAFSPTEFIPKQDTSFRGELTLARLGEAKTSRIHSSAGNFTRNSAAIRRDQFDGFLIIKILNGEIRVTQSDTQIKARSGEALIYRHGIPFELEFPENYRAVSLWVDPDSMYEHCPSLALNMPSVIRPDGSNGHLALTMVQELCLSAISRKTHSAQQLVGATLDIVSTTLTPSDLDIQEVRNQLVMEKLSDLMRRNMDNTSLSLDHLVDALGVSARTLNRIFATQGTTPMRWVWDQRLATAHNALTRGRVRSVTEAAFSFGFKDVAHFSRAFSKKYGVSPKAVMKQG